MTNERPCYHCHSGHYHRGRVNTAAVAKGLIHIVTTPIFSTSVHVETPAINDSFAAISGDSGPVTARTPGVSQQEETPKKRRLRKALTKERVKCHRLLRKLSPTTSKPQPPCIADVKRYLSGILSGPGLKLVTALLENSGISKHRRRWTDDVKAICLSIFYQSRKAYAYLRTILTLPSVRTLKRPLERIEVGPGMSPDVIELLKHRVAKFSDHDRYCVLSLDEMAFKANLAYEANQDKIIGFIDHDHLGRTRDPANQAQVFMLRGIFTNWKQPLGFYLSENAMKSDVIPPLLFEWLDVLADIGLKVKVVVCDQGSGNQSLYEGLGITIDKPYFERKGTKYIAMYDPPHLLKSLCNTFKKHDLMYNGHRISWKHIYMLYDLDSQAKIGLRLAPKLTRKHVDLAAFSLMKVSRAAQVFSHTVSAAINTYVCSGQMPAEALQTANFIRQVDQMFDCFNVSSIKNSKLMRRAVRENSPHWDCLKDCNDMLSKLEVIDSTGRVVNLNGWQQDISALRALWDELARDPPSDFGRVDYLLTRRLNQDALENFLGLFGNVVDTGTTQGQSTFVTRSSSAW